MNPRPGAGSVRIIAGRWRGRRLPVPAAPGLRPTADRVRETLFNWLAPLIAGSRCLDCFAGSGALGLEAASRGAGQVVMLEQSPLLVQGLAANLTRLGVAQTGEVEVARADALAWLARPAGQRFDIVFLDPPFNAGLLGPVTHLLAAGWLAEGARVYLEADRRDGLPALPAGWTLHRDQRAGQVAYGLAIAAPPTR